MVTRVNSLEISLHSFTCPECDGNFSYCGYGESLTRKRSMRKMAENILEYGATVKRSTRRFYVRVINWIVIVSSAFLLIRVSCDRFYYRERYRVFAVLHQIKDAKVTDIHGYDQNLFQWVMVDAQISLDNDRSRTIMFNNPIASDLQSGAHLIINSLGTDNVFILTGDERYSVYFDVGYRGEFSAYFPFKCTNVSDVAKKYDQILNYVAVEPEGDYINAQGKKCHYKIIVK